MSNQTYHPHKILVLISSEKIESEHKNIGKKPLINRSKKITGKLVYRVVFCVKFETPVFLEPFLVRSILFSFFP